MKIDDIGRYGLIVNGKCEVSIDFKKTGKCDYFRKMTTAEIQQHFSKTNKKPNTHMSYRPNELEFISKKYLNNKLPKSPKQKKQPQIRDKNAFFG